MQIKPLLLSTVEQLWQPFSETDSSGQKLKVHKLSNDRLFKNHMPFVSTDSVQMHPEYVAIFTVYISPGSTPYSITFGPVDCYLRLVWTYIVCDYEAIMHAPISELKNKH